MNDTLQGLIDWYQTLTLESVGRVGEFYAPDAHFVDPFNDVRGVAAIEKIFHHMFTQVENPRFLVKDVCSGSEQAMLVWEFSFRSGDTRHVVPGATHLRFDPKGQVCIHQDYWDPASALFMGIPVLGWALRGIYRRLRAV
ncbi:nuclear transport factor 2 family protein [Uliginosibacterium sp. 31-16]|uniref:nuclear transport factor 2 family protein n=1 Tax=Uliginosibacterium sp. 31-16 TaxID=3068315 RepID=UPI00273F731C|nr:nuclear transport factor 2 family protein [Uliginosibacterium sp. 31-16]MDP5238151.1 nuclear transport factor 2 family protein [Uliginosibacterium sp. 31-16]